ncbi:MAG: asparaginase [Simplicispira suum]|uniref:asparaginase n=1 Tax=Simplicispira suum TaxID=2109915 RepID=UPI001C6BDDE6|nr:asparaginase [Simplicispira suum]MBW7833565.1 asparaginase [Simplicispira suum]
MQVIGTKIVVLGTGGTIAGSSARAGDNVGYRAGERTVQSLLDALPVAQGQPPLAWVAEQIAQIDSKDADASFWSQLHARCREHLQDERVRGIVVAHGTDTLEETAWLLAETLPATKPLVLTCAMRPATAASPDGPQNLLDAVALASDARALGVSVVCAGAVHAPHHVQKMSPYRVDAFGSGDAGPTGWMEEGRLRLVHPWPPARSVGAEPPQTLSADPGAWPWVEIVLSHASACGRQVDALVSAGVRGIVVAGTGNGTLHHALEVALLRAQEAGVAVRVSTRCPLGVVVGRPAHGLPLADGLSPVKARISLMLELMRSSPTP